jgi:dihydrofolate reductase
MLISGSTPIVQALIARGLIDEYRLVMCPIVLGSGRALFRDGARSIPMKLSRAKASTAERCP